MSQTGLVGLKTTPKSEEMGMFSMTVKPSQIFNCQSTLSSAHHLPPAESTASFLGLTAQPMAPTQVTTFQIHSVFQRFTTEPAGVSKPPCSRCHPPFQRLSGSSHSSVGCVPCQMKHSVQNTYVIRSGIWGALLIH